MIMSGGSKQPRCLPRCDRCFSVLFRRSSSAVVCLLVKRLSHGRKCLQPCCARTASEHSSQTGRPSLETSGRAPRHLTTASLVNEAFTRVVSGGAFGRSEASRHLKYMARAVPRGLRRGYYAPVACCGGRALRLLKLREQVRALGLGCQDDSPIRALGADQLGSTYRTGAGVAPA
jgi:hypothetical protein